MINQTEIPEITEYIVPVRKVCEFILAGNCRFFLWNKTSNIRYAYEVKKHEDNPVWFVRYSGNMIGTIVQGFNKVTKPIFRIYTKDRERLIDHPAVKVLSWYLQIHHDTPDGEKPPVPKSVVVYHEGQCGACGRPLTDPASIMVGVGPDCRRRLGL